MGRVQPVEVPRQSSRSLGDHVEVDAHNEDADAWRVLTAVERGRVDGEGGPGQGGEKFDQERDVPTPVRAEREQCTAHRLRGIGGRRAIGADCPSGRDGLARSGRIAHVDIRGFGRGLVDDERRPARAGYCVGQRVRTEDRAPRAAECH